MPGAIEASVAFARRIVPEASTVRKPASRPSLRARRRQRGSSWPRRANQRWCSSGLAVARQARIVAGVDHLGLADGGKHALGCGGIGHRLALAQVEVFLQRHFLLASLFISLQEIANYIHGISFRSGCVLTAMRPSLVAL